MFKLSGRKCKTVEFCTLIVAKIKLPGVCSLSMLDQKVLCEVYISNVYVTHCLSASSLSQVETLNGW